MITGITPEDAIVHKSYITRKGKDILIPPSRYVKDIPKNTEIAILNAMNISANKRTKDMETFTYELTTKNKIRRKSGKRFFPIIHFQK